MGSARSVGILIVSPDQLAHTPRPLRAIVLAGWPEVLKERHERRLSKWGKACGCSSGAATMLAFAVVAVLLVLVDLGDHGWSAIGLATCLLLVGSVLAGAIVGKLVGLAVAALRWRQAVRDAVEDGLIWDWTWPAVEGGTVGH